jgi:hypothetical protein
MGLPFPEWFEAGKTAVPSNWSFGKERWHVWQQQQQQSSLLSTAARN